MGDVKIDVSVLQLKWRARKYCHLGGNRNE